ncbi:DinB family protein [Pedobacter jamesrossensis]|uniref:DinB family protein n=1 Tax=Pedobacter jamesrossensis TaxID=1908238 RepID=A0ABV8NQE6_9SPHI
MENDGILISELKKLLNGGSAHAGLKDAIDNLPFKLLGLKVQNLPYTIWQLIEHIRIAQWDMLEFSKAGKHTSPRWPDDYWPKELAPKDEETWRKSLNQIDSNRTEFIELMQLNDLLKPIEHGSGQNILREALQIADHNAYHIGEIIVIRRLLGAWKS